MEIFSEFDGVLSRALSIIGFDITGEPPPTSVARMCTLTPCVKVSRSRHFYSLHFDSARKGYPTAFPRTYYEVTPGREGDPAWRNPYAALYYPEKFRKMTEFREIMSSPEEWTRAIRGRRGEKTF